MPLANSLSAMSKDKFFTRRRKGIDYKAKRLVLQDQDVKVAIFYSHGDELSVFRSHPHLPDWPFPKQLLGSIPILETNMESYHTEPKHVQWMAEWNRREGISQQWPQSQSIQANDIEPNATFEEAEISQSNGEENLTKEPQSVNFIEGHQVTPVYDQGQGFSSIQDLVVPEFFTTLQGSQSSPRPSSIPRQLQNVPDTTNRDSENSEDDLTDEEFVNLGSENRHRNTTPHANTISPLKRARGNNGQYFQQQSLQPPRYTQVNLPGRLRHYQPRRTRSDYHLQPQSRVQLHDGIVFQGNSEMYGSPPLTRARAARITR